MSLFLVIFAFKRPKSGNYGENPSDPYKYYYYLNQKGRKELEKYGFEEINITSFDGLRLNGYFVENKEVKTNHTILMVHGYKASGFHDMSYIHKFFLSLGYNLLIIDNRGHGKSEGKWISFGVLDSYDVISWCNYLDKRFNKLNIILYGISMGAATIINASGNSNLSKSVKAIIGDCGFSSGYDEISNQLKEKYHLPIFPFMNIADFYLKIFAHYSLKDLEARESIKNNHLPILIIHGGDDKFVKTEMGLELFELANDPKELLIVDHAYHAHSRIFNQELYDSTISSFISKYVKSL